MASVVLHLTGLEMTRLRFVSKAINAAVLRSHAAIMSRLKVMAGFSEIRSDRQARASTDCSAALELLHDLGCMQRRGPTRLVSTDPLVVGLRNVDRVRGILAFSGRLIVNSEDPGGAGTIRVWNRLTPGDWYAERTLDLNEGRRTFWTTVSDCGGGKLLTAFSDGSDFGSLGFFAVVWDTQTWTKLHVLSGHTSPIGHAFAHQNHIVTATWLDVDNCMRLWKDGVCTQVIRTGRHIRCAESLGDKLLCGVGDENGGGVLVWDAGNTRLLTGHQRSVEALLALSNTTFLSGCLSSHHPWCYPLWHGSARPATRGPKTGDFPA